MLVLNTKSITFPKIDLLASFLVAAFCIFLSFPSLIWANNPEYKRMELAEKIIMKRPVKKTTQKPEIKESIKDDNFDSEIELNDKKEQITTKENNKIIAETYVKDDSVGNDTNDKDNKISTNISKNQDSPTNKISNNLDQDAMSVKMWGGLRQKDVKIIQDVAILLEGRRFEEASKKALLMKESNKNFYQPLQNIILWTKYKTSFNTSISFSDLARFVIDNNYLPNIGDLENGAEKLVLAKEIPFSVYDQYFIGRKPKSKALKFYLLEDRIRSLKDRSSSPSKAELDEIQEAIVDLWVNGNFSLEESRDFLQKYGNQLTEVDHINKIDKLIWNGNFESVKDMIPLVRSDYQKLFLAIIEISKNPQKTDDIIDSVPYKLRNDEHLQYRKLIYYHNKSKLDDLYEILESSPANSKHSFDWWKWRNLYGRELLKEKKYDLAYKIISKHNLEYQTEAFAEAEWLSGWIALRFLNNPKVGLKHFKNLYDNVSYPISASRAAYWMGMAYEAMNDNRTASYWYKIAANYPTYFYGQIAIHKYRNINDVSLSSFGMPKDPVISNNDIKLISQKMSLKVAYLLALMNQKDASLKIVKNSIQELNSRGKIAAIVKLVEETGDANFIQKVYRFANRKNVFFIKKQFRVVESLKNEPNAAILHALIKQESGFSQSAVSSVGALGLMQVMPDTARRIAQKIKIPYSASKLASDPEYNIKIGSYYINSLLEQFNGSKILAIASYNAGPGKAVDWMRQFYDPRQYGTLESYGNQNMDKVVDWIELITYGETRNYVQRVMENLLVYEYLVENK